MESPGVLGEGEAPQQDGDEAGAKIQDLIPGPTSNTLELGRIRSHESYNQMTFSCCLSHCRPSYLRTRPRQPKANTTTEGYKCTTLAMPSQLLEPSGIPVSMKRVDCKYLGAYLLAAQASGYLAIERPSLRLESNGS